VADDEVIPARAELPPPAYVILGMLRMGMRSGYDVKQAVDLSARFFFAISQAQIYPLLKRLEEEGLVEGRSEPRGQRRRRVYEVTPAGEEALRAWLRQPGALPFEIRDVATVKLFFADLLEPGDVLEHVRAMRARSEQTLEEMRVTIRPAAALYADEFDNPFPQQALDLGMTLHEAIVGWADRAERQLTGGGEGQEPERDADTQ
jgi:DNA-binding PadR family transcriptional regulator